MKTAQLSKDVLLLAPGGAATAAQSADLDCAGANYATIRIALGAELNTNAAGVTIALSESDDTVATNFATFSNALNRVVENTAATVATCHVDLEGRKRYIRLTVTPDTTTNGPVTVAAVASLVPQIIDDPADLGPDTAIG